MPPTCWICEAPADSREHKIKRSDLVREFGTGAFDDGDLLHAVEGQRCRELQGPNSSRLKYQPVLCGDCNSARSQPWDRAYEAFNSWVFEHQRTVLSRRFVNLYEVFGEEGVVESCPNLYKYFVKAFGCRLASAGYAVPSHLVALMSQDHFLTKLRLTFAVYKAVFALPPELRQRAGLSDLLRLDSRSMGRMERYLFQLNVGWLVIGLHYDIEVPPGVGAPWTSDSACIYLGEIEGPTLDELIGCARCDNAPALAELEALRDSGGIRIE
jgi:hypothetical protein